MIENIDASELYDNPWIFNGKPFYSKDIPKDAMGFVYVITEILEDGTYGRRYVGKKLLVSTKTVQKNGKKKKVTCESDWKKYWSSSSYIKDEMAEGCKFKREIVYITASKGMNNYMELKLQVYLDVLEYQKHYLNGIINCRLNRTAINMSKLLATSTTFDFSYRPTV